MFYFIRYVENDIFRIILLICLATLLFYALGNIIQKMFNFKTNNNNFPILFGIISYLLITFVLYTPFMYFHLDNWENLLIYLYFIKQFIFTLIVLLFINSLFGKLKNLNWKQINNIFVSIIVVGLLVWLFHFLLISIENPFFGNDTIPLSGDENIRFQSMITELLLIVNMKNNNINGLETILKWIIPFITISFLYWSSKLLFINVSTLFSIIFSTLITILIIVFLAFVINESLIYIVISIIYLYFVVIYLYSSEIFGENLIISFGFFVLFSLFTITSSGISLFILFGLPTIAYLFFKSKSTVSLFLLFSTLFCVQLFFILTTSSIFYIYGLLFLLIVIIVSIPMYAILNPAKIKDLIQLEKSIKKNASLVLYFSLGITILFAFLLGLKSGNNVFFLIENAFVTSAYPFLLISYSIVYSLYFMFSLYICFFKKNKVNNLLLITSLILVIGFNPLTLPLFYHIAPIALMNINIYAIYFTVLWMILFLNLFKYLQDKLSLLLLKKQNSLLSLQKKFFQKIKGMFKTNSFKQKNK